ncbi:MAG: ABC transporter permease [Clostridium sp.]|jgi:putative ABC transport system permease protein|nr:ABC transporter permease [Clostridium sp.]
MFVLRNALLSISRSKGRNILIGIIVFAIALAATVALAIRTAAADAKESGLSNVSVTASISRNIQSAMGGFTPGSGSSNREDIMSQMQELQEKYPELSFEQYEQYAADENVDSSYYSIGLSLNAGDGYTAYSTSTTSSSTTQLPSNMPEVEGGGRSGGFRVGGMMAMGDFTVTGVSDNAALTRFTGGQSSLNEGGSMPDYTTDDYSCIISSELALYNDLAVGGKIVLTNPSNEDESYTFKVVGIYTNSSTSTDGALQFSTAMDPANTIYISAKSAEKIEAASAKSAVTTTDNDGNEVSSELSGTLSYVYKFADQSKYEAFKSATEAKLGEYYSVSSSDVENYEKSLEPLENLGSFALTFLIVVLSIGAVILVVINMFNIRERKYEVGVLTAIGIKKSKVAAQFVAELLIVTLIAVALGAVVGAVVSVPVGNSLLESQVESLQAEQTQQNNAFGGAPGGGMQGGQMVISGRGGMGGSFGERVLGGAGSLTEYSTQIEAAVGIMVLLQLIGIGLLLTLLSSLAAVVFILRYEPLKILAERS